MGSSRLRHLTHWASLLSEVSPDGKTLLTINEYGIRAWSLGTGKLLYQLRTEFGDQHPAFSPDGKRLAVTEKAVIYLRDPATGQKLQRIPAGGEFPKRPVLVAFSVDGVAGPITRAILWLWSDRDDAQGVAGAFHFAHRLLQLGLGDHVGVHQDVAQALTDQ